MLVEALVDPDPGGETAAALRRLWEPRAGAPGSGVARVYSREEIRARGGDPRAALAIGAAEGFVFVSGYTGEAESSPSAGKPGHHGYDSEHRDLRARRCSTAVRWCPVASPGPASSTWPPPWRTPSAWHCPRRRGGFSRWSSGQSGERQLF